MDPNISGYSIQDLFRIVLQYRWYGRFLSFFGVNKEPGSGLYYIPTRTGSIIWG